MKFTEKIRCTLKELYTCRGIDGFDDLLEEKLGFDIAEASWKLLEAADDTVLLEVQGDREVFEA